MLYHRELSVWTSNMRRAKDTAREVKCANLVEWRSLREIEVRIRFINNTRMRGGFDLYPPVCLSFYLSSDLLLLKFQWIIFSYFISYGGDDYFFRNLNL